MYLVHTGWQTKTPVYKLTPGGSGGGESGEAAAFRLVQTLDSKGPHDAVRRSSKFIHIIHAHLVLTSCSRRAHAYAYGGMQEGWMMHGRHYLFLSEDRGPDPRLGTTPLVDSTVYVMEADGRFAPVQKLATDGAHAAEHFSAGGARNAAPFQLTPFIVSGVCVQSLSWQIVVFDRGNAGKASKRPAVFLTHVRNVQVRSGLQLRTSVTVSVRSKQA
jgi:hypothetical protein